MSISLNASVSKSLQSLLSTTREIEATQYRLSTGKKVNSAIDDAGSFFTAKSLSDRASDLAARKDGIAQGIQAVQTAIKGSTQIDAVLKQMKGLADQAKAETDATKRGTLKTQYDDLRDQIDDLSGDASYKGVNLIKGTADDLSVIFNEDGTSKLDVTGTDLDAAGLSVTAAGDWGNATLATGTTAIDADIDKIRDAIDTVRTTSATLGSNLSMLQIRSDFTSDMVAVLNEGAGKLVNADLNEEGAKMMALQTRQQLGTSALSMAIQSEQSVLSLIR